MPFPPVTPRRRLFFDALLALLAFVASIALVWVAADAALPPLGRVVVILCAALMAVFAAVEIARVV